MTITHQHEYHFRRSLELFRYWPAISCRQWTAVAPRTLELPPGTPVGQFRGDLFRARLSVDLDAANAADVSHWRVYTVRATPAQPSVLDVICRPYYRRAFAEGRIRVWFRPVLDSVS